MCWIGWRWWWENFYISIVSFVYSKWIDGYNEKTGEGDKRKWIFKLFHLNVNHKSQKTKSPPFDKIEKNQRKLIGELKEAEAFTLIHNTMNIHIPIPSTTKPSPHGRVYMLVLAILMIGDCTQYRWDRDGVDDIIKLLYINELGYKMK